MLDLNDNQKNAIDWDPGDETKVEFGKGPATGSEWGHGQADRGAGRKTEVGQDP